MNTLKRVVIFGATSAIAEQVSRQLVSQGASLFCVGRNNNKLTAIVDDLKVRAGTNQKIEGFCCDLVNIKQHQAIIERAQDVLGDIDAVLIAHGTLPTQQDCENSVDLTLKEIETNALSIISLLTLLANYFEPKQKGVISVISSVAGDRGRQSNYVYGASKGMVSLFLQGLRNRLAQKGVDVVTIKPGFVDTPMTASFNKSGLLWSKPDKIAQGIVSAMVKGKNEVYLPGFWWGIMFMIKHIPESIFKKMSL
ncbi:short-chain dehydrogenase [Advenella faeciporci]|uniref:Short-chain dehydrogenase n=1 Tax=Advenella faeciporci TaxID=797535 RepID=A0A918MZC6_9BURK|nr:SDR family oxidoreductase [Advenella faeciporci]GGW89363.1 short-chain dehydrogenase [Advenella faeciporci]